MQDCHPGDPGAAGGGGRICHPGIRGWIEEHPVGCAVILALALAALYFLLRYLDVL